MRVALVVPGGVGDRFPPIPALRALAVELSRHHDVIVFSLLEDTTPSTETVQGVEVRHVAIGQLGRKPNIVAHLTRQLAAWNPDIVHAFWLQPPGLLAGIAAAILDLPLVVSLGGRELLRDSGSWQDRTEAILALRLARVVTAGSPTAAELVGQFCHAVQVVPLGPEPASTRDDSAANHPATGSTHRLIHVASLSVNKNQALLLDVVSRVSRRISGVHVDVFGPDLLDGRVQRMAAELGVEADFRGRVENQEVRDAFETAHLHLVTSRWESQSVVTLEAALSGVPTVGTPVGLVADFAEKGAARVASEAEDLADVVVHLLENEDARTRMGRSAQRLAGRMDSIATSARFSGLYREAIGIRG